MRIERRARGNVFIPWVYVVDCARPRVKRLPIEEVRRKWRLMLAEVRKARSSDGG